MKANDRNRPDPGAPQRPLNPLSRAAFEKAMGGVMGSILGKVRRRSRYGTTYTGPTPKLDGHDQDRIDAAKVKRARKNQRRLNEFHR